MDSLATGDEEKERIKNAIALKDGSELAKILDGLGRDATDRDKKALGVITSLFGGKEVLEKALSIAFNKQARVAVENLARVLKILDAKGFKRFITIDMAEIRGFDYYTGIIFEGFAKGAGKAIMAGGRYDSLMQKYGYPCAAVGFAFDIENIAATMTH